MSKVGPILPEIVFRKSREGLVRPGPVIFEGPSPRWTEVWGKGTHNSYHMNRNRYLDAKGEGASEQVLDQMLFEHVSSFEFDVRPNIHQVGEWTVMHTERYDFSQCNPLTDCFQMLRAAHYALPDHDPIMIMIELKNTAAVVTGAFDDTHTMADLDWQIRQVFGSTLYEPADFFRECPGATTLTQCLEKRGGWPTLRELRGKFVVFIMGNWNWGYADWVAYGSRDDIATSAAFPMRSIFTEYGEGLPKEGQVGGLAVSLFERDQEQLASDNSIAWQVEGGGLCYWNREDPGRLRLVRAWEAEGLDGQMDAIAWGGTWYTTNRPWNTLDEHLPDGRETTISGVDPSRRYRDPLPFLRGPDSGHPCDVVPDLKASRTDVDPNALREYGNKLYVSGGILPFLYQTVPDNAYRFWETTVSVTRVGDPYGVVRPRIAQERGHGCLRAAASARDWIEIGRYKDGDSGDVTVQDRTVVQVRTMRDGALTRELHYASTEHIDSFGALLGMSVENRGPGAIVRLYSTGRIGDDGTPAWSLMKETTFPMPLNKQGLATSKDVQFVGTRVMTEAGTWTDVNRCHIASFADTLGPKVDPPSVVNYSWPPTDDDACVLQVLDLPTSAAAASPQSWRSIGVSGERPAVINRRDGTLITFHRAYDGSIRYFGEPLPGGNLGGELQSGPAVGAHPDGKLHVFAVGGDSAIWHISELAPGGIFWGNWASLGGSLSDVVVGQNLDGRLELFGASSDGSMQQNWEQSVGGAFSGWHPMSDPMGGNPAVTCNQDGRQVVFVRGQDGALWHKAQSVANGVWDAWTSLGGAIVGRPSAVLDSWGYVVVFAQGTDGTVWSCTQSSPNSPTYSGWTQRSTDTGGQPAAVMRGDGGWDVYFRASDQRLLHMTQADGVWISLGAAPGRSDPVVGRKRDGGMAAIFTDFTGNMWATDIS